VAFGILPFFAFANAGVTLEGTTSGDLLRPVPLGIAAGLTVGKLAGVLLASAAAIRLGLATLPAGASWSALAGVSALCGVGFTMGLFIAGLAFEAAASHYMVQAPWHHRGLARLRACRLSGPALEPAPRMIGRAL
jgi:NhaA family Na+:H+ antiporter